MFRSASELPVKLRSTHDRQLLVKCVLSDTAVGGALIEITFEFAEIV